MKNSQVVFLIGFMGCGKTTLGKRLSNINQIEFADLDALIEKRQGKRLNQIFDEEGESGFRKIEADVLRWIDVNNPKVISVGGGTPCFFDNMTWMKEKGLVVYLQCSPLFLHSRLTQSQRQRPLLKDVSPEGLLQFIQTKLKERDKFYLQADVIIDANAITVFDLKNAINHFGS